MSDKPYQLATQLRALLLHDNDSEGRERRDVAALVASGDCFVTIATSLDDSTKYLRVADSQALPQIEGAISILMHLQQDYRIIRKHPEPN